MCTGLPYYVLYIMYSTYVECHIAGKFGRYKIWQTYLKKLSSVFKFDRFARKYSVLVLFAVVSGTEKYLAALAGPFSVAYFPNFALPSIRAIISVGTLSSTALTFLPHRIFLRHQSLLHAFIHLLYFFLQKSATLMHSSFLM